jgi:hypothetical protein
MMKTTKTILFMTACFGLMFTSLSPALFAEVAKPVAAVGDGQNIWVTDSGHHRLVKLRASDGTLLGSHPIPSPLRLIYDGQNVWTVSNAGVVTKVQAKDGVILGSYPAGGPGAGIAFDGENIWSAIPKMTQSRNYVQATGPSSVPTKSAKKPRTDCSSTGNSSGLPTPVPTP